MMPSTMITATLILPNVHCLSLPQQVIVGVLPFNPFFFFFFAFFSIKRTSIDSAEKLRELHRRLEWRLLCVDDSFVKVFWHCGDVDEEECRLEQERDDERLGRFASSSGFISMITDESPLCSVASISFNSLSSLSYVIHWNWLPLIRNGWTTMWHFFFGGRGSDKNLCFVVVVVLRCG